MDVHEMIKFRTACTVTNDDKFASDCGHRTVVLS